MTREEILAASSMPLASPSYPKGPYRFIDREYLLIHYEFDPDVIRAMLPEPLEPDGNHVIYEWMKMLDSSGFGSYQDSGIAIAALWSGTPCNFSAMMFLDDESPTTGGREICGFPKEIGLPNLSVVHDTLTGTMGYKYQSLAQDHGETLKGMGKLDVNLKWIPDVDGSPKIAQRVGYHLEDIRLKGAWAGPTRLHLAPHSNCRVAELPVRKVLCDRHLIAGLTLPYGFVLHDYLA